MRSAERTHHPHQPQRPHRPSRGFTLIEVVVVLAILGVLAAAARPLLELAALRHKEQALREGLRQIRGAIDAYERAVASGQVLRPDDAEPGQPVYPATLQLLVDGAPVSGAPGAPSRYFLRRLPRDPFAEPTLAAADTWATRSSDSGPAAPRAGRDVFDIASRHTGTALDGTRYDQW
jgi:general secretion pathway protein G